MTGIDDLAVGARRWDGRRRGGRRRAVDAAAPGQRRRQPARGCRGMFKGP